LIVHQPFQGTVTLSLQRYWPSYIKVMP